MQAACDIAVVGSGFAGSLIAMIARRLGRSVVLLEKAKHPRFVIGESSTPLSNLLLEQLAERYDLATIKPFTKYGSWMSQRRDIPVGLKRGFTFYHHQLDQPFVSSPAHANELLVAASPNDRVADTHWYRPAFDFALVTEAQRLGVTFIEETELWGIDRSSSRHTVLQGRHRGQQLEVHAEFVLDATGPRGFLHRSLELPEVPYRKMPATQGLYSHFTGVKRWDSLHPSPEAPFPVDDAAMHHIFDGGWMWVLRFNNGTISAGVAVAPALARELRLAEGAAAWDRMLDRLPAIREQFAGAKAVLPFVYSKQLAFLSGYVADQNWALLPSAAGFVDPLLSTGFPLTLLGIERLAGILERSWGKPDFAEELFSYSMQTTVELVTTERLIAALYATMHDFELFRALTLLYFAAATFTEAARRAGKPELAGQTFLLGEHPVFGPRFRYCVDTALLAPTGEARQALLDRIAQTVEPVNLAGLGDPARGHWYPAHASDVIGNAAKLDLDETAARAMLQRCGFA